GASQLSSGDDVDDLQQGQQPPQDRGGVDADGQCVVAHGSPQNTLPGISMQCGSKTDLIERRRSRLVCPRSSARHRLWSTPTPCSPVSVPPSLRPARKSSLAASQMTSGTLWGPGAVSMRKLGCRLPSPAWATVGMLIPYSFSIRVISRNILGRAVR